MQTLVQTISKIVIESSDNYLDPNAGACACYNIGDEFVFERDGDKDDFWHMGLNTLVKTSADPADTVASGPKIPHCSEAWDAIARYIYTGLRSRELLDSPGERRI